MPDLRLTIAPYARRDESAVYGLLDSTNFIHQQMDWIPLDDWLHDLTQPTYLAWSGRKLVGLLSLGLPLTGASWIRLIAVSSDWQPEHVLSPLWATAETRLRKHGTVEIGALVFRPALFVSPLELIGFKLTDQIVTLGRQGTDLPNPLESEVKICVASWEDINTATQIDHTAFNPIWRMGAASLRHAARNPAYFTLAMRGSEAVGYQITTAHGNSVHLARLAVLPTEQGHGIGGQLIADSLNRAIRLNTPAMSVNTQGLNAQSLSLYRRYGFERTFNDTAFYYYHL